MPKASSVACCFRKARAANYLEITAIVAPSSCLACSSAKPPRRCLLNQETRECAAYKARGSKCSLVLYESDYKKMSDDQATVHRQILEARKI
jgi:hypothetical protein